MNQSKKEFDVILIGSGMGALCVGSILSQFRGKRVLFLERHYVFGGFTHEFSRRDKNTKAKYSWDVGIHYVGDMNEEAVLRRLMDAITRKGVDWKKMPDVFEKFVYPDFTLAVPSDESKYKEMVIALFPDEADAIRQYFEDVRSVGNWFGRHNMSSPNPFVDKAKRVPSLSGGFATPDITTKQYFDANFKSEKLKGLLQSQWGDYGIPPSQSSFIIHAMVVLHYFNGGYYPVGGAGHIGESVIPIIEEGGGEVRLSTQVEEILVENGKAVGVRARNLLPKKAERDGETEVMEFRAPVIVSNAGVYNTYMKLLPPSVPISFREQLKAFYEKHPVVSSVTLYLGLKKDPREMGFHGENHWIFDSYDHDKNFAATDDWIAGGAQTTAAFLSFPSVKNPNATSHTAEIISLPGEAPFQKWLGSDWKNRGEDYEQAKAMISEKLLAYIDRHYPGFSENVIYQELSTPLTVSHFTGHVGGAIYGTPSVRERFRSDLSPWCTPLSPVEGLYLTGSDVSSPGIAGALMGGVSTLNQIPDGISLIRLLKETSAKVEAQV